MKTFKQSTNFTAIEPTKTLSEGRWILVTIALNLYNVRRETDAILAIFQHKKNTSVDQSETIPVQEKQQETISSPM